MKKIPTLFERKFENHQVVKVLPAVAENFDWVLRGEGIATVKFDGACCAILEGELYKRYDAKKGKRVPAGAIKCQETPDPVTGHFPCWVKCKRGEPSDKWFWKAFDSLDSKTDGTYEAIGLHFQGNPYDLNCDRLIAHGREVVEVERTYEGIRHFLEEHYIEGIVFWKAGSLYVKSSCAILASNGGGVRPLGSNNFAHKRTAPPGV